MKWRKRAWWTVVAIAIVIYLVHSNRAILACVLAFLAGGNAVFTLMDLAGISKQWSEERLLAGTEKP